MPVSSGGRKWGRRAALGEESRDWSGSEEAVVTQKTCPQYLAVRVPTHGRRWQEWVGVGWGGRHHTRNLRETEM